MLLRCCLIHISIIILRRFIYLLYLCPCLHLGLFMPYLRESIFIFVFIFIMINCIISWIQTCLFFCLFFRICPVIVRWYRGCRMPIVFGCQKFSLRILLSICLIFANFSLALLIKVLLIGKRSVMKRISEKLPSC